MAKGVFSAQMNSAKHNLDVKLELYKFKEDNAFILYCPALDLSAYGMTEDEAEFSFSERFRIYINYCMNKNTLVDDLKKNGWSVKSLKQRKMKAPNTQQMLDFNETLRDIIFNKNYEKTSKSLEIPELA